jgi:hypothetical protein
MTTNGLVSRSSNPSEIISNMCQACGINDPVQLHGALSWLHDSGNIITFQKDGKIFGADGIVVLDPRYRAL